MQTSLTLTAEVRKRQRLKTGPMEYMSPPQLSWQSIRLVSFLLHSSFQQTHKCSGSKISTRSSTGKICRLLSSAGRAYKSSLLYTSSQQLQIQSLLKQNNFLRKRFNALEDMQPPQLSWQSVRLKILRSLVQTRQEASVLFFVCFYFFFIPRRLRTLANTKNGFLLLSIPSSLPFRPNSRVLSSW